MPSNVMVQARLSRLMVATQHEQEKHDINVLNKGGWLGGWLAKSSGYNYTKIF
jgi:predicted NAD/FAD-dependent oxidoreductase